MIRSLAEEISFDGYLTFNGQYCYTADGTVYRDVPLDVRDVHAIAEKADAGLFDLQVMQLSRTFVNRRSERVSRAEANVAEITPVLDLSHIDDEPVYQLCAFVDPGEEHVFADACAHVTHTRWCDAFCDVIPAGGGKPAGIAATLERWGIAPEDCIAFGDGGNDVPMFGCVGVSVAMGKRVRRGQGGGGPTSHSISTRTAYTSPARTSASYSVPCTPLLCQGGLRGHRFWRLWLVRA